MASIGWFVINGVLQEFHAEGSSAVLQATASSLMAISQEQAAAVMAAAVPPEATVLPPPSGSNPLMGSFDIPHFDGLTYAGMSEDGSVVYYVSASGERLFFNVDAGTWMGLPPPAVIGPLVPAPSLGPSSPLGGGTRPTSPALAILPPFIGGELGLVIDQDRAGSEEVDYVQFGSAEFPYVAGGGGSRRR